MPGGRLLRRGRRVRALWVILGRLRPSPVALQAPAADHVEGDRADHHERQQEPRPEGRSRSSRRHRGGGGGDGTVVDEVSGTARRRLGGGRGPGSVWSAAPGGAGDRSARGCLRDSTRSASGRGLGWGLRGRDRAPRASSCATVSGSRSSARASGSGSRSSARCPAGSRSASRGEARLDAITSPIHLGRHQPISTCLPAELEGAGSGASAFGTRWPARGARPAAARAALPGARTVAPRC